MIALVVATVFSAAFGLILNWAQMRRCNLFAVALINYLIGTGYQLGHQLLVGRPAQVTPITVWLGVLVGALYGINLLIFAPLISRRGVSISTAVVRLAVLVPVLAAILIWRERPLPMQYVGIGLTLVAMPLMTLKPGESVRLRGGDIPLLLAMFLGSGLSMVLFQLYEQLQLPGEDILFLTCLFGAAAVLMLIGWLRRREGTSTRDILPGVVLGVTNALGNALLLRSLQQVPGVIVFPFYSAVGLVLAAVYSRVVWSEELTRRELLGLGLATLAVLLVNLG